MVLPVLVAVVDPGEHDGATNSGSEPDHAERSMTTNAIYPPKEGLGRSGDILAERRGRGERGGIIT